MKFSPPFEVTIRACGIVASYKLSAEHFDKIIGCANDALLLDNAKHRLIIGIANRKKTGDGPPSKIGKKTGSPR